MGVNISDIKYQGNGSRKSDFDWVSVLLIFIAIGIIVGAIFFIFQFRESTVAGLIEADSMISAIIVENNGENTETIYLGFYNPGKDKLAFIAVPPRTRLKVDYEDRPAHDIIGNIYPRGGVPVVKKTIEKLTATTFDYYLVYDLKDVEILVDLLEGIKVNSLYSLNYTDLDNNVFIRIHKGLITLDGSKTKEFLLYKYGDNGSQVMLDNHRLFIEALLGRLGDVETLVMHRKAYSNLVENIDTNLSKKDMLVLIDEMRNLNSSRILFYRMFGKSTIIKDEEFITPIENGTWLQDRIEAVKKFLNDDGPAPIGDEVNIEILNGSGNPGQAQSLRNYFLEYGFNVVHYGNAMRNDYEKTIVIDRVGRPSLAKRIADIVNCKEVYTRIDKTLLVDITIIIGNDFEGKYVR
jgi:anionic cell wall polymer biosynthesis LytR-Cps2A-Psr (LCP) family protein